MTGHPIGEDCFAILVGIILTYTFGYGSYSIESAIRFESIQDFEQNLGSVAGCVFYLAVILQIANGGITLRVAMNSKAFK